MAKLLDPQVVTIYSSYNIDEARELGFFKFEYVYMVFDVEKREVHFNDRVVYCVDREYMLGMLNSWNSSSKYVFGELNVQIKFIHKYYLKPGSVPQKEY